MNRSAFTSAAVLLCSFALATSALAQGTPAADQAKPSGTAPAAQSKWTPPIKGVAKIEVVAGTSKKVGTDIVTVTKVKNVSDGPIALLRMDELWYNSKREQVTGDTFVLRRPFQPGEIIEITTKSPAKPDVKQSQYMFSHANGKIEAKSVKSFDAASKDTKAAPKKKK